MLASGYYKHLESLQDGNTDTSAGAIMPQAGICNTVLRKMDSGTQGSHFGN
jgi:hypothetical protein